MGIRSVQWDFNNFPRFPLTLCNTIERNQPKNEKKNHHLFFFFKKEI